MSFANALLLAATALAALIIVAHWFWRRRQPPETTMILVVVALALIGGSTMLDRNSATFTPSPDPVAVVVAFDLSPSMLAIPDPAIFPDTPPRYVRARDTLRDVLKAMEERNAAATVALIGFSKDAEIMLGWDSKVAQLNETLQFGLSPDLFTSSGTSIEAAIEAVIKAFDMLPAEQKANSRKVLIFVSDGEDTSSGEYLRYALSELAGQPFDVVALQAGMLGVSEGVPQFNPLSGDFLGFDEMSGNVYTTPDANTMLSMSRSEAAQGLYVRVEQAGASDQVLAFLTGERPGHQDFSMQLLTALGLLLITALLCATALR